jgi:hypothetical protein
VYNIKKGEKMISEPIMRDFSNLPPYKIALIVDGEVADILHTDDRLLAIFTSNPVIVDVTEQVTANPESIMFGAKYDSESNTFINPTLDNSNQEESSV